MTRRASATSKSTWGRRLILGEDHGRRGAERERVLDRLVGALRHAEEHHPLVLAEGELRGADEVAHVLDEEEPAVRRRQARERVLDLVGVQVTGPAGLDLRDGDPEAGDASRVEIARLISLDAGARGAARAEGAEALLQQRRLARARRAHQVQAADAPAVEEAPVVRREAIVWRAAPSPPGLRWGRARGRARACARGRARDRAPVLRAAAATGRAHVRVPPGNSSGSIVGAALHLERPGAAGRAGDRSAGRPRSSARRRRSGPRRGRWSPAARRPRRGSPGLRLGSRTPAPRARRPRAPRGPD